MLTTLLATSVIIAVALLVPQSATAAINTARTAADITTYSLPTAYEGLYYSKIAYCDQANIQTWTCAACGYFPQMQNVSVIEAAYDTQVFVAYNPSKMRIVVGFRGSTNIPNWIADLSFFRVPYPHCVDCSVHEGFYTAYLSLSKEIIPAVRRLYAAYPYSTVFVSGHSLGAALSILCALDVVRSVDPAGGVILYNFGEPRVGDTNFAIYASATLTAGKQFRVVHRLDPVPHLPPRTWGFTHTWHEVWYDNNGNSTYTFCRDSPGVEDPRCSDSVLPILVEDHLLYLGIEVGCIAP